MSRIKDPLSLAILLLASITVTAQTSTSLAGLGSVTINLKSPEEVPFNVGAFSRFQIIDERPDTALIGIHTRVATVGLIHTMRAKTLVFPHAAATEIADYLNKYFTRPDAPYTALIVLRNLWLSDANNLREDMIKDPDKLHERTHIRLKAELYACKDSLYLPLIRFDTLQVYKRDNKYTGASYYSLWDHDLAGILNHMADSAARLIAMEEGRRRQVTLPEIIRYNQSRFTTVIGSADSLIRGVYASFDEFRNNNPSVRNFEIRVENKARMLYIKEPGGNSYYSHNAWGYCDGKNIFVMRDGILCYAWREGNGFYFYGGSDREVNIYPGFAGIGKPGVADPEMGMGNHPGNVSNSGENLDAKIRNIFMIDMDSGNVY